MLLLFSCNNLSEQGFTDISEAKNLLVNEKKEGKWVEYFAVKECFGPYVCAKEEATYYTLSIYEAGLPTGVTRTFYMSGSLWKEDLYQNGKLVGPLREYWGDGQLRKEASYKVDKLDGFSRSYFEDGTLQTENNYELGKKIGVSKEFYDNGALWVEAPYINGRSGKQWKYYYKSGKLRCITSYEDLGANGGETTTLSSLGELTRLIPYERDDMWGTLKEYYENGKLEHEVSKTKKDGALTCYIEKWYYENGKPEHEIFRTDKGKGIKEWYIEKWYYENGKLKTVTTLIEGKIVPATRSYDENGREGFLQADPDIK